MKQPSARRLTATSAAARATRTSSSRSSSASRAPSPSRPEEHPMGNMNEVQTSPIGQSLRRREDRRFLTGDGQYTDDVTMHGQTYGVFLRSPHAHARIRSIKLDAAKKAPGVLRIFTGADLAEAKVGGLPCGWLIHSKDGTPMKEPAHPVLAQGKVRHVGDQVALVVAESIAEAKDAAELIEVDYEELPAVIDIVAAAGMASSVHDLSLIHI